MTEKRVKRIKNLKENAKDQIDMEIKNLKRELDKEKDKLNSIEDSLGRLLGGFQPSDSCMNVMEFELFYNSLFELEKEVSRKKNHIRLLEEDLELKREKALELNMENKLLDILLKRLIKERLTRASRDEQKEMDFNFIIRRLRT